MITSVLNNNLISNIADKKDTLTTKVDFADVMNDTIKDIYKVNFKYYTKPENSQPITTKSMQKMYQGLEDRAKETYIRIHKAEKYADNYRTASNDKNVDASELRDMYMQHVVEMNSPLVPLDI